MTRNTKLAGLVLLAAACATGSAEDQPAARETPVTVAVETVVTTRVSPVEGVVAARLQAELATRHMARIADVVVEPGDAVVRGQRLILLGQEDIAVARAKAVAGVEAAAAALDEARRHAARMDTLLAADAVSKVQRDQARLQLVQAQTGLALARAGVQEVEASAEYSSITAPFAGTVVARYADPGDLANPGVPLLEIAGDGAREAVLSVPVQLARDLEVGDTVAVRTRDGREAWGPVRTVSSGASQRSRAVEVRVAVPTDWTTGIGVTAMVPGSATTVVAIPQRLVIQRGQLTGVRVWAGDRVAVRWIRLGRSLKDGMVEVLSGLEPGDLVAT